MSVLIIADVFQGQLVENLSSVVNAGLKMNDDVHVLIAGDQCSQAAEIAANIEGVSKVLLKQDPQLEVQEAKAMTELVLAIAEPYAHILAPASTQGKNHLPRISAKLGVEQISDIIAVQSDTCFDRSFYAGNAIATVESSASKHVITVRPTAFDKQPSSAAACPIEELDVSLSDSGVTLVSQINQKSERPELGSADVVISGGRGMQNGDNFALLEKVADKIGAAIGASRAAVDAGFVPNDMQVGQTGKIVAPQLYIAVGISGAIQHLAGMKDSKFIVAINKDEDAPIFQVADYGLVADLFDVLPELEAAL